MIPKQPPPRLKDPKKWSPEFLDFIEKCLQKEPGARATAKELLMVMKFRLFFPQENDKETLEVVDLKSTTSYKVSLSFSWRKNVLLKFLDISSKSYLTL